MLGDDVTFQATMRVALSIRACMQTELRVRSLLTFTVFVRH
jgi:hypothetical protein